MTVTNSLISADHLDLPAADTPRLYVNPDVVEDA